MRAAEVRYPVCVDRSNLTAGALLGRRVVPLWTVLDEVGNLIESGTGGPDARVLGRIEELLARPLTQGAAPGAYRAPTVAELEALHARDPADLSIGLELASRHASERRLDRALHLVAELVAAHPEEKSPLLLQADLRLRQGERESALAALRRAWELDREDWLVRKQIWCLEEPDRFYAGEVDYRWQKEQIAAGR